MARVETLFTFIPPGPPDLEKLKFTAFFGTMILRVVEGTSPLSDALDCLDRWEEFDFDFFEEKEDECVSNGNKQRFWQVGDDAASSLVTVKRAEHCKRVESIFSLSSLDWIRNVSPVIRGNLATIHIAMTTIPVLDY